MTVSPGSLYCSDAAECEEVLNIVTVQIALSANQIKTILNKTSFTVDSFGPFSHNLRLLATDGALVPVPTCAEVLLLAAQDLLQSAHIGSRRERGRAGEAVLEH